jgi:ABC transporter substrate binding protein
MQFDQFRRRDFITLLGGAGAWPLAARAQQTAMPVVGFLHFGSPGPFAYQVAAFDQGLRETGYAEAQNLAIEYRWAEGQYHQLPALATDLHQPQGRGDRRDRTSMRKGGKTGDRDHSNTFTTGSDPVRDGLVASLARPGGNVTGVSIVAVELVPKRLELLSELVPQTRMFALLVNPNNGYSEPMIRDVPTLLARAGRVPARTARAGARRRSPLRHRVWLSAECGANARRGNRLGGSPRGHHHRLRSTAVPQKRSLKLSHEWLSWPDIRRTWKTRMQL